MSLNRQSSQPDEFQGFASRHEIREAFRSASAKYRREPRRHVHDIRHSTIQVTCHLCHYTFEYQALRPDETVSCPSCGVRFELKQQYQSDSIQIEQIELELARLRAEIETNYPQRRGQREKSVIGPLPMQTLKKGFEKTDNTSFENHGNNFDYDSLADSARSHRICRDNQPILEPTREQWRESHCNTPKVDPCTIPCQVRRRDVTDNDGVGRISFARYSENLRATKTKFRIKIAVVGILLCVIMCTAVFTTGLIKPGNRPKLALRNMPSAKERQEESVQVLDISQRNWNNSNTSTVNPLPHTATPLVSPNRIVQVAAPGSVMSGFAPEITVSSDADVNPQTLALLDQQLQETQTQLSHITRQYELTKQNNEQLERMAKQNEAESFLWEAYSHTVKDPVRSMVLSLQAIERFKELEIDVPNNARWVLNQSLASQNLGIPFKGFQGGVDAMTLSRDGQWFLFAGNDGTVWLWDVSRHDQPSGSFRLDSINGGVAQLLMTSNIHYGICVGRNGAIRIWNLKLECPFEAPIDIIDTRCHFTHVITSEDGRWLAAYGKPGHYDNNKKVNDVFLWDLNQLNQNGRLGQPIVLKGHEKPIRSLTISSDSKWLVSGSEDRTVRVYDLKAGYPAAEQIVLKGHELAVNCVAISPDSRWLVTGGGDFVLRIWDMQSRQSMAAPITLQEHEGWITTLAFSPDGKWLASGSYDNTIRIWRMTGVKQPEVVQVLTGHNNPIKSVEFSRQGNQLVSLSSMDHEVRLWNLEQGNPSENALAFRCGQIPISSAKMTGDGKWLILAQQKPNSSNTGGLRLWPLVFDDAFDFAVCYAETRFPSIYKRRQNMVLPTLEQHEERIARTGPPPQTGIQFPVFPDAPVLEQRNLVPPGNFSFGGYPVTGTPTPPVDSQFPLTRLGNTVTMSPR